MVYDVSSGRVCNDVVLGNFGSMFVSSGGVANSTTIISQGKLYVNVDGTANATTVSSWGSMYVSSGGTANSTVVNSQGRLYVYSGGTANSTTVKSDGHMDISCGGVGKQTTVRGGLLNVDSGGVADSTSINDGHLVVSSGGIAEQTIVNNGHFSVNNGGVVSSTTVYSQGRMYISSGGTGSKTSVIGYLSVKSGGTADFAVINLGGYLYVEGGASALKITENGGYVNIANGTNVAFLPHDISGSVLSSGQSATLHSGTTATLMTIKSKGSLCVCAGGVASGANVSQGGYIYVSSGGTVNSTTVNYGGTLCVLDGGIVDHPIIAENGKLSVLAGGTALNVKWTPCVGRIDAADGATVIFASNIRGVYFGSNNVLCSSSLTMSMLTLSGHSMYVMNNGTANSTGVYYGGSMYISSGGVANRTSVGSSGYMEVTTGGITNSATVYFGGQGYIRNGGVANFTHVYSNGCLRIFSGGVANCNSTYICGEIHIYSGGVANSNIVNSGSIYVHDGGVASGIDVKYGGCMFVSSNGKITGELTIANGAEISVTSGAIIDFSLLERSVEDGYLVNNLSLISGSPDFTITVSSAQESGTYKLAQGASTFTDKITLRTPDREMGVLTVGETATFGDVGYILTKEYGNLMLTLGDFIPPTVPTVIANIIVPTIQNVTVSATFSEDSKQKQYSLDGANWADYTQPVVMTGNGTVYFRGIDAAGNVSEVTSYAVTNIDKIAPDKPTAGASTNAPTNQNVTVTAVFSEDSTVREFSLDDETWAAYTQPIVMSDNGTVYFRGADAAGNVSEVTSYAVTNIDKTAPTQPAASADVTTPTNGNVTVTATFCEDSETKEYSLDNSTWNTYTQPVVLNDNGTVFFRGIDAVGNISEVASYAVTNIDKTAPAAPTAGADTATPTNGNVTVTASFSEDSVQRLYSLDGQGWASYGSGVVMTTNGTVYFRGIDAAGNISNVASYQVTNIDKVPPTAPVATADITAPTNGNVTVSAVFSEDSVQRLYSLDAQNWASYVGGVVMEGNGTVYFRGIDAAGNISEATPYQVTNIDKSAPKYPLGVVAGGFSGGASTEVLKHAPDGSLVIFNTQTNTSTPVGSLDRAKWAIKGAGDYSHTGATEVLMQNLQTGDVRLVANAAAGISEESVEQSLRLGIVSGGYELGGVGNFNGSTHPGVLLTAPELVSPGWSKVTGLACWTLDNAFNMSPGWLGAMVTTWDNGVFKMDPADLAGADDATINAKYYSFELIGVGDFNGDGRDDVMIRNNMPKTAEGRTITGSGDVFVFLTGNDISGFQEVNVAYTGCAADPWRLAGVGDLNGDGIQDAILQNTEDGTIASWILNSEAKYVNAYGIGTLTAGQSFAGVGDVNGDGTDDVLFTDFDGSLKAWTVQNGAGKGLIALG